MQALASARLERDWPAARFHPGDLDWWVVQDFGRVPGIEDRVRLWFADGPGDGSQMTDTTDGTDATDGALVAFGWFSPPGELDFLTAPDDPAAVDGLVAQLVAWADERRETLATAEVGPLRVWAASGEPAAPSLRRLGLEPDLEHGFVHFTGDLALADAWGPEALPAGLTIRPLATDADIESRVACGRAAFTGSTMFVERYRTTFDAWLYRRDLDLLVVDRDGTVVAFTLGWLDLDSGVVELEPVGVHPDWHRRGLGREICRAALRRARDLGARRAVIGAERSNPAAMGLYASLGLTIGSEIVAFGRPLEVETAGVPEVAEAA